MSCPHGNHPDACDICDEVAAAYASGVKHTKRKWVGLTDEEADNLVAYPWRETKDWVGAIEKALKEKNT